MPRNNHFEDATAKALDLLPHDDAARSDPRLVRDAKCLEEIRAVQEAAADVWLAASPLRAAPPEVLSSLMSKVETRTPLAHRNVKFFPWLAASGWAAAAIAFLLWPRDGEKAGAVARVDPPIYLPPHPSQSEVATGPSEADGLPALPKRHEISRDRRMREELLRLQAQVNSLVEQGALDAPRVLGLHSPNSLQPGPEETHRRVTTALADALAALLELESGAPGDPARMVLQRGWLPEGLRLSEGEYIRHLNFPAAAADELGLLVSEDGAYYDRAKDMIWYQDESGRGYLGRKATPEDDLTAYHVPGRDALALNQAAAPSTEPEGFLIEDPESNTAKVLIDQVPPPAPGYEQVVVWTDAAGNEAKIPVQNPLSTSTLMGTMTAPTQATELPVVPLSIPVLPSMAQAGANRLFFSLPDSNGVTSFSLIEQPTVANGKPAKVIVSGERRGNNGNGKGKGPKLR